MALIYADLFNIPIGSHGRTIVFRLFPHFSKSS
jgi:hypothetical protein